MGSFGKAGRIRNGGKCLIFQTCLKFKASQLFHAMLLFYLNGEKLEINLQFLDMILLIISEKKSVWI